MNKVISAAQVVAVVFIPVAAFFGTLLGAIVGAFGVGYVQARDAVAIYCRKNSRIL